jgi:hypothetical protein
MLDKPEYAFDPEHVFSRGLCGPGANWTLTQEVCGKCNARFSAYEAHWMRQAFEATARNFYGLEGRSEKQRFDRVQPIEVDDCYLLNKGDSTVYEAGLAFPADHHRSTAVGAAMPRHLHGRPKRIACGRKRPAMAIASCHHAAMAEASS